ncbi:MAG: hypothetical protein GEU73_05175 [Chloroflexi bacterium]|nr:hypothetical protein [Chloroflexota bacterium]
MDLWVIIATILGSGGLGGFIVALLKAPSQNRQIGADTDRIIVSAASDVVVIQSGVLETLREELNRATSRYNELDEQNREIKKRLDSMEEQVEALREHNEKLTIEKDQLQHDNDRLVTQLEALG